MRRRFTPSVSDAADCVGFFLCNSVDDCVGFFLCGSIDDSVVCPFSEETVHEGVVYMALLLFWSGQKFSCMHLEMHLYAGMS